MRVSLSGKEIELLLTAIEYSKYRVGGSSDSGYEQRQEQLAALDVMAEKLRKARALEDSGAENQ